jgi:hypothetical protein
MSLQETTLEHRFQELPNIYLSRDIKSILELYGQRLYTHVFFLVYVFKFV